MNRRELLWSAHCVTSSVIIDDLDLVSVAITPYKTDPPLVVDSKCCAGLGDRRRVPRADFPEVPGARRSCNDCALFSIASFRRATFSMLRNRGQRWRIKSDSVSLDRKVRIIWRCYCYVMCQFSVGQL